MTTPTREEAFNLLKKYTKSESLISHALSVEAVMRHFAEKYGEDPDKWGVVGLIHDIDYEMYPEEHCSKAPEILEENHWPDEYVRAVVSHGWDIFNDVKPESLMEKVLYAIDELTGLVAASALVRPSKSVMDMKTKSVKKKWKNKKFAAGVNREVIEKGAKLLDMDIGDLITETIMGMRNVAEKIGLKGNI